MWQKRWANRPEDKSRSENRLGEGDSPLLLRGLRKSGTVPGSSRIGSELVQSQTRGGRCALAVTIATVAVVWLAILPLIGRQPVVSDYILRNERLGIDPAAKFYTELPCMPGVYNRVERSMQRARAAVASPAASPAP
jgi:hypothetical protein